jgi:hypothetical protein
MHVLLSFMHQKPFEFIVRHQRPEMEAEKYLHSTVFQLIPLFQVSIVLTHFDVFVFL